MTDGTWSAGDVQAKSFLTRQLECHLWLQCVAKVKLQSTELSISLRDGVVLVQLVDHVAPGWLNKRRVTLRTWKQPVTTRQRKENIAAFLLFCKARGIPDSLRFRVNDLYLRFDMAIVVRTLRALAALCTRTGRRPFLVPVPEEDVVFPAGSVESARNYLSTPRDERIRRVARSLEQQIRWNSPRVKRVRSPAAAAAAGDDDGIFDDEGDSKPLLGPPSPDQPLDASAAINALLDSDLDNVSDDGIGSLLDLELSGTGAAMLRDKNGEQRASTTSLPESKRRAARAFVTGHTDPDTTPTTPKSPATPPIPSRPTRTASQWPFLATPVDPTDPRTLRSAPVSPRSDSPEKIYRPPRTVSQAERVRTPPRRDENSPERPRRTAGRLGGSILPNQDISRASPERARRDVASANASFAGGEEVGLSPRGDYNAGSPATPGSPWSPRVALAGLMEKNSPGADGSFATHLASPDASFATNLASSNASFANLSGMLPNRDPSPERPKRLAARLGGSITPNRVRSPPTSPRSPASPTSPRSPRSPRSPTEFDARRAAAVSPPRPERTASLLGVREAQSPSDQRREEGAGMGATPRRDSEGREAFRKGLSESSGGRSARSNRSATAHLATPAVRLALGDDGKAPSPTRRRGSLGGASERSLRSSLGGFEFGLTSDAESERGRTARSRPGGFITVPALLFLGDGGTGKTTLIRQAMGDKTPSLERPRASAMEVHRASIYGETIDLIDIGKIAEDAILSGPVAKELRRAAGFVLVYSVTSMASFTHAVNLRAALLASRKGIEVPILLVGTHIDRSLERTVTAETVAHHTRDWRRCTHFDASGKAGKRPGDLIHALFSFRMIGADHHTTKSSSGTAAGEAKNPTKVQLFLHVLRGFGLASGDPNGLSDPYAIVQVEDSHEKTSVKSGTLNPEWGEGFVIDLRAPKAGCIVLEVWDHDKVTSDDFLGRATICMEDIPHHGLYVTHRMALSGRLSSTAVATGDVEIMVKLVRRDAPALCFADPRTLATAQYPPLIEPAQAFVLDAPTPQSFAEAGAGLLPALEEPPSEDQWYQKFFVPGGHTNYMSHHSSLGPIVVSVATRNCEKGPQYWVIVWQAFAVTHHCVDASEELELPALLRRINPELLDRHNPYRTISDPGLVKDLTRFERGEGLRAKFGVIYAREGQTDENDMFSNTAISSTFDEFLNLLGERVRLRGFTKYCAQLDTREDNSGTHSVYRVFRGYEVMFHVSTLLRFDEHDAQRIQRKRFIGNDIAVIVFMDGTTPYRADTMKSSYTNIIAVVQPAPDKRYRLSVARMKGLREFGPLIGDSYPRDESFVDVLLTKLFNSETATLCAPEFLIRERRTRGSCLSGWHKEYFEAGKKDLSLPAPAATSVVAPPGGALVYERHPVFRLGKQSTAVEGKIVCVCTLDALCFFATDTTVFGVATDVATKSTRIAAVASVEQMAISPGLGLLFARIGGKSPRVVVIPSVPDIRSRLAAGERSLDQSPINLEGSDGATMIAAGTIRSFEYLCVAVLGGVKVYHLHATRPHEAVEFIHCPMPVVCMAMMGAGLLVGMAAGHHSEFMFVHMRRGAFSAAVLRNVASPETDVRRVSAFATPHGALLCFPREGVFLRNNGTVDTTLSVRWTAAPLGFAATGEFFAVSYSTFIELRSAISGCVVETHALGIGAPFRYGGNRLVLPYSLPPHNTAGVCALVPTVR